MARRARLLKLIPVTAPPAPTLASKVTGHNLANITYLVSQAAERGGFDFEFKARFTDDGSLAAIWIPGPGSSLTGHRGFWVVAGTWVFLAPGQDFITWGGSHPVRTGLFTEAV